MRWVEVEDAIRIAERWGSDDDAHQIPGDLETVMYYASRTADEVEALEEAEADRSKMNEIWRKTVDEEVKNRIKAMVKNPTVNARKEELKQEMNELIEDSFKMGLERGKVLNE